MKVTVKEEEYPCKGKFFGVFYVDGKQIGMADKTPDGYWIIRNFRTPVSFEDVVPSMLRQIIEKARRNEREAKKILAQLVPAKPKKQKEFDPKTAPVPDYVPKKAWVDFCEYRAQKKKPVTQIAYRRLLDTMSGINGLEQDVGERLYASIDNGWTGVFAKLTPRRVPLPASLEVLGDGEAT